MPNKRPTVKNGKQYEKLKEKGVSKSRAARIVPPAARAGGLRQGRAPRTQA